MSRQTLEERAAARLAGRDPLRWKMLYKPARYVSECGSWRIDRVSQDPDVWELTGPPLARPFVSSTSLACKEEALRLLGRLADRRWDWVGERLVARACAATADLAEVSGVRVDVPELPPEQAGPWHACHDEVDVVVRRGLPGDAGVAAYWAARAVAQVNGFRWAWLKPGRNAVPLAVNDARFFDMLRLDAWEASDGLWRLPPWPELPDLSAFLYDAGVVPAEEVGDLSAVVDRLLTH